VIGEDEVHVREKFGEGEDREAIQARAAAGDEAFNAREGHGGGSD
jgi:hypothetical protein